MITFTEEELGACLERAAHEEWLPKSRFTSAVPPKKIAPTPDRFPRRPGAARKRPLGG